MTAAAFRIPVIGDVHLGPNARQPQRLDALVAISRRGHLLENLGAWFYLGDLFHQDSTPDDRNTLAAVLIDQADVAPVVIIRGNHDKEGDLGIFGHLRTRFPIVVCEYARTLDLELATGQAMTLGLFPWPSEAHLIAAGVAVSGIKEAARPALQAILLDQGRVLAEAQAAGRPVAWLGHATVTGAIASNGQPQVGTGIELDAELLNLVGKHVPKFLGHIHKPQTLDGSACYVGSICRLDFGEAERKRFLIFEGESLVEFCDRPIGPWDYNAEDVTLEVPPLIKLEGELKLGPDGLVQNDLNPADGSKELPNFQGAEVRVVLRYPIGLRDKVEGARDNVRAYLLGQGAAVVSVEPMAIPEGGLRAPAVAAAVTLEEKVRAWADASSTPLPAHVPEALELLCHNDPDAVLADVQAMVDELLKEAPANAA